MDYIIYTGEFVISDRGGIVENRHRVHAAAVDVAGKVLDVLGDPSRVTLIRSAAKPIQAITVVESGAMERFGFDEADLALMCSSGNARGGTLIGGHPAISPAVIESWTKDRFKPSPVYNAYSGNHIDVIAGAKAIGTEITSYHMLNHPIRAMIKFLLEDLTYPSNDIKWVLDSCNKYSPAISLQSLALAYAALAHATASIHDATDKYARAMTQIYDAMVQHPENIGSDGRFCSALIAAYGRALVGKGGGDGCYAIAVRESEDTRRLGAQGAVGIALKIEDGNSDVMDAAAAELLEQLRIGARETWRRLDCFHRGDIRNSTGVITRKYTFPFKLRTV
ncbi:thermolabile L-asparaginase [Xylariaceae sp. FL1651]|nr:thermolabile L-asparaginase [Xylariaceae sp. FL1651]